MRIVQDSRNVLWVGNVLLLLRLSTTWNFDIEELSYVQFIDIKKTISRLDRALWCVYLRWETEYELYWTSNIYRYMRHKNINSGEDYGLLPFSSAISTIQVMRSNMSIAPFPSPIPSQLHRFYIKRLFTEGSTPTKRFRNCRWFTKAYHKTVISVSLFTYEVHTTTTCIILRDRNLNCKSIELK